MQYGPPFILLKAHAILHEPFFVKKIGDILASAKNGFASNSPAYFSLAAFVFCGGQQKMKIYLSVEKVKMAIFGTK